MNTAEAIDHIMPVGEILMNQDVLTPNQVDMVLSAQESSPVAQEMVFGHVVRRMGLASRDDVKAALRVQRRQVRVIASEGKATVAAPVAKKKSSQAIAIPQTHADMEFRELRSSLLVRANARNADNPQEGGMAIAVLSTDQGDGRSFVASNLATAFASSGKRTLVVDAHFAEPRLHSVFGVSNDIGLASVLTEEPGVAIKETNIDSLYVLPAGEHEHLSADLVCRDVNGVWLDVARRHFDVIVIDTPPALADQDALIVSQWVDDVVVVVRRSVTRTRKLQDLISKLRELNARVAGCVLNR